MFLDGGVAAAARPGCPLAIQEILVYSDRCDERPHKERSGEPTSKPQLARRMRHASEFGLDLLVAVASPDHPANKGTECKHREDNRENTPRTLVPIEGEVVCGAALLLPPHLESHKTGREDE